MKLLQDVKSGLRKVDRTINRLIDRLLPQDLTFRYMIGLGVVATFSIFGQIMIQTSLTQQVRMQDQIRQLENNLPIMDDLKRSTLTLQLSSHPQNTQTHAALIKSFADRITLNIPSSDLPQDMAVKLYSAHSEVSRYTDSLLGLLNHSPVGRVRPVKPNEIGLEADHLIAATDDAIRSIKNVNDYLENRHRTQVADFQKVELILTFLTLLTLVLEALYIFRPAVRKLYDSLQVRSDFLSRMSHEIRNPMNSIIGMANLLTETQINDQQKRYLAILTRSSRGLLDLLNNLLDFSSAESGKIKVETIPFDLHEVIERTLDLAVLGAQANGLELVLDLSPNVPLKLVGDPSKIQQILTNLLGNAIKFTQKGHVVLKIEAETFHEQASLTFSVIDTGVGIDAERLPTVFEPFVQEDSSVKRRFGGSGLGLTISKQIVEKMNGSITVSSQKGVGSEFSFTLTFLVNEPSSIAHIVMDKPLGIFNVTLVKKEGMAATALQYFISACGGKHDRIEDQEKLIEILTSDNPKHLLMVDHELVKNQMPTLLPLLARMPFDANRIIFLIKTTATSEDLEALGRVGIKNLLFKPVKPFQFYEVLETALVLPRTTETKPSDLMEKAKINLGPTSPLKILAVDDSHDNQTLIALYLENTPYKISYADNGRIAIQKFKEERFDVVLMDLQMPEVDGYTATATIREWEASMNLKPVPIIAVSAHDLSHNQERFRAVGFDLQLVKPIDAVTLQRVIQETAGPAKAQAIDTATKIQNLEKKLASMAPAYLEKRKQELVEIHKHVEERDFKSLQMIGHRLKGNARTYNFGKLGDIGAELEKAATEENLNLVKTCVAQAEAFINSTVSKNSRLN